MIERARILQERIDKKKAAIYNRVTIKHYFFFLAFVFFITGMMLMVYCLMKKIHPLALQDLSSPILYLGIGMECFIGYIFTRNKY